MMRRREREVHDHDHVMHILNDCDCLRLGLADAEAPYIVPVSFGWEELGGELRLYFHSAGEGRKIDLMRRCPRVGFEMDCAHQLVTGELACRYSYLYASIVGVGTVDLAATVEAKRHGLRLIMAHYAPGQDFVFPEAALERVCVGCLRVEHMSCKEHA